MKPFLNTIFCLPLCAILLVGCATQHAPAYRSVERHTQVGSVTRIDIIQTESRNSGGGAVLGAVLGGVIGHQLGGGRGRNLTTGAGVIGGAIAGNNIENRNRADNEIYRVTVSLDNGRTQQFDYQDIEDLRVGDRVRIEGGQISAL